MLDALEEIIKKFDADIKINLSDFIRGGRIIAEGISDGMKTEEAVLKAALVVGWEDDVAANHGDEIMGASDAKSTVRAVFEGLAEQIG